MRKIKIVSDSSSDLLMLDNVEFASSPVKIITAEREFVDDENLNVDEWRTSLTSIKKDHKHPARILLSG